MKSVRSDKVAPAVRSYRTIWIESGPLLQSLQSQFDIVECERVTSAARIPARDREPELVVPEMVES